MYSCKYTTIIIMNTIDDMRNEKYFYSHYNEFEYIHDYEQFF